MKNLKDPIETQDKTLEKLKRENRLLHAILDSISDGVYAISHDGEILVYNRPFERMEGTKKETILGRKDSEIYSAIPTNCFQRTAVMQNGKPLPNQFMSYLTPAGKKVDLVLNSYPFIEEGEITAVYEIARDMPSITELTQKLIECFEHHVPRTRQNGTRYSLDDIIGSSRAVREAVQQARRIAQTKSTVTIIGETGVGKELFAQGIHNAGSPVKNPFVPVNCAAIPDTLMEALMMGTVKGAFSGAIDAPGFFEQAEGGALFLDEINSLSLRLQPKLLRLLEEKTVKRLGDKVERRINCRVICASNTDLFDAADKGLFREDLLYRITPLVLHIPPLRSRKEDILPLAEKFIAKLNAELNLAITAIDPAMTKLLITYNWPGNVRELRHCLECAMTMAQPKDATLTTDHLPAILRRRISRQSNAVGTGSAAATENQGPAEHHGLDEQQGLNKQQGLNDFLLSCEKTFIEDALAASKGNITAAAKVVGISRQNLHYRLRKLGIKGLTVK